MQAVCLLVAISAHKAVWCGRSCAARSSWGQAPGELLWLYQLLEHGAGHEQWIALLIYAIVRDATVGYWSDSQPWAWILFGTSSWNPLKFVQLMGLVHARGDSGCYRPKGLRTSSNCWFFTMQNHLLPRKIFHACVLAKFFLMKNQISLCDKIILMCWFAMKIQVFYKI